MRRIEFYRDSESGFILYLVAVVAAILSVLGLTLSKQIGTSLQTSSRQLDYQKTLYVSDGMKNILAADVGSFIASNGPNSNNISPCAVQCYLNSIASSQLVPNYSFYQNIQLLNPLPTSCGPCPNPVFSPSGAFNWSDPITVSYAVQNKGSLSPRSPTALINAKVTFTVFQGSPFSYLYYVNRGSPGSYNGSNSTGDYADFAPGAPSVFNGKIYSAGDLCISGMGYFTSLIAAGRVMTLDNPNCLDTWNLAVAALGQPYVSTQASPTPPSISAPNPNSNYTLFSHPDDYGCTNCGHTGQSWGNYSQTKWNKQIQDITQNVAYHKLPAQGMGTAQQGRNQESSSDHYLGYVSNNQNLRYLVDPPMPNENSAVSNQKFAQKSDIRVIDGVWYLRDPSGNTPWPGMPIWSDHPGSFTEPNFLIKVGQDDIKAIWSSTSWHWGAHPPKGYSYYSYDTQNSHIFSPSFNQTNRPVISYGNITLYTNVKYEGASPLWGPAHFVDSSYPTVQPPPPTPPFSPAYPAHTGPRFCSSGLQCSPPAPQSPPAFPFYGGYYIYNPVNHPENHTEGYLYPAIHNGALDCGAPVNISCTCIGQPTQIMDDTTTILNSTRSGFVNNHIRMGSTTIAPDATPSSVSQAAINPMNFDLGQFAYALKNFTGPGELGTYFGPGSYMAAPFNGIIYISATWPGSLHGLDGSSAPAHYPGQGSSRNYNTVTAALETTSIYTGDRNQSDVTSIVQQNSLPYPLCSANLAGNPFDHGSNYGNKFTIPDCNKYETSTNNAFTSNPQSASIPNFINAIRVMNGGNISKNDFSIGLSVVSNLPVYITGDINTTINRMPMLIAGDQITVLSNEWSDAVNPWNQAYNQFSQTVPFGEAKTTTINAALLTGVARSTYVQREQMHTVPALIERWEAPTLPGQTLNYNGSIIIGYYPVYQTSANFMAGWAFTYPPFTYKVWDSLFQTTLPPGASGFTGGGIVQMSINH